MLRYEYKVIPAPKKPGKIKGVRGTEAKFAAEMSRLMNELGAEGWEYQRSDTLPCEERQGLTGKTTTFQNMLVFRRESVEATEAAPEPSAIEVAAASLEPVSEREPVPEPTAAQPQEPARSPMLSFRSATVRPPAPSAEPVSISASTTPKVAATRDIPEGNAPQIRFRASDIAAQ